MKFTIKAASNSTDEGLVEVEGNNIPFGVTKQSNLSSPAELLISSFAACCLKNVERFSEFMRYDYENAEIRVDATRKDKPPIIEKISFSITIFSKNKNINTDLLLRNLEKFGTIYNTLNSVCEIKGDIKVKK